METLLRLRALLSVLAVTLVLAAGAATAATAATAAGPAPSPGAAGLTGAAALAGRGTVTAVGAPALPRGLTASSWLVADLDTGEVLAAHDAHGRFAPASTLKTLTALTLVPRLAPARLVRPAPQDLAVDGSKVGLVDTVAYPVRELFTAMMVASGNDAANTLATAAGGVPRTVGLMNAEAARLNASDTHAVNPTGLDAPGQLSSAYDLALIGRAGMAMPDFRRYVATKRSTVAAPKGKRFEISTHDRLIRNYPGAIGIKNGYTVKARASFVGAATRGGHTLLVTLMHAEPRVWAEGAALLDWGFAARAAGVAPVATLVGPGQKAPAGESTGSAVGAPRVAAGTARVDTPRRSAPLPYAGLGAAAATLALLGLRRRRRRFPRR